MPAKAKKSTAKSKKKSAPKDHLGSRDSFQFALHVATLSVLIVVFVTMLSQIGRTQNVESRASVPVEVEPVEVVESEAEEAVLGIDTYEDEYDYYEEEYYEYEDEYYFEDEDVYYFEDEYIDDEYDPVDDWQRVEEPSL